MKASHKKAIEKYEEIRIQARELAHNSLPAYLRTVLHLDSIGAKAISAFRLVEESDKRIVDWNWVFASRYCELHPKAFDLSTWYGNSLCSLSLGRPTYNGTEMRLDFVEKFNSKQILTREVFGITLLAYEAYGKLIGASKLRIMNPTNEKVLNYYISHGGFSYIGAKKGNPHYLVKQI